MKELFGFVCDVKKAKEVFGRMLDDEIREFDTCASFGRVRVTVKALEEGDSSI